MELIPREIIIDILGGYTLPLDGIHGPSHWGRVLELGSRIAAQNGADLAVVKYFSVFHDSRRWNEGVDHGHGNRGAELAEHFKSKLDLTEIQLEELKHACRYHTDGTIVASVTVQTCWDADRLDLWRVGIQPCPSFLCTTEAKDQQLLEWSRQRSMDMVVPECSRRWFQYFETHG